MLSSRLMVLGTQQKPPLALRTPHTFLGMAREMLDLKQRMATLMRRRLKQMPQAMRILAPAVALVAAQRVAATTTVWAAVFKRQMPRTYRKE